MATKWSFIQFSGEVSMVGCRRVFDNSTHWLRRLVWISLLLFGIGCTGYIISQRIRHYLSEPKSINVAISNEKELEFPTLSICSLRLIGHQWLEKLRPGLSREYQNFIYVGYNHKKNSSLPDAVFPLSQEETLQFFTETAEGLQEYSYCHFLDSSCPSDMFSITYTDYHQCLLINGKKEWRYNATNAGSDHSIWIDLKVNLHDLFPSVDADSFGSTGFGVALHQSPDRMYHIRKQSIILPTNKQVKIGLEKAVTTLLSTGSAPCRSNTGSVIYSKNACLDKCLFDSIFNLCGCTIIPSDDNVATMCMRAYEWSCNEQKAYEFETNLTLQEACGCLEPCTTVKYSMVMSYSDLAEDFLFDESDITVLQIYYSTLSVEHVTQQESYGFWAMMSDIGGALGLFIGSTTYTVIEVIDFIVTPIICRRWPTG